MKEFLIILLLVVGFFLIKTFYQAGQFKSIDPHFDGRVTQVYRNMAGPEDLQLDYQTGNLFISSATRRKSNAGNNIDGIYLLNIERGGLPILVPHNYQGEFHPHGISLLRKDSVLYLFVVNHNNKGDFVELFRYSKTSLEHLNSYSSEDMCCPNDVIATDIDKFYVTNDHGAKAGIMRLLEDYLRIPRASIFYFGGQEFNKVAGPFNYANGINMSADKSQLYLTTTISNLLVIYEVKEDGSLQQKNILNLGTGLDNIDVDEAGNLWIAAHPKLIDYLQHAKDSTNYAPSQVLKLTPSDDYNFDVDEIYLDDGSEISASSTAVYYRNELFIGVVLDNSLLRATIAD